MKIRTVATAVITALAATLSFVTPSAADQHAASTHRLVAGVVFTTATEPDDPATVGVIDPLVVTADKPASVVVGLGRVTLRQREIVVPDPSGPPFGSAAPFRGTLQSTASDPTYLQVADGSRLYLSFDVSFVAVDPAPRELPPGVPWPIRFPAPPTRLFTMTVTGGTGQFAGASGTLRGAGAYSFMENMGFYTVFGTLTLPARGLAAR